MKDTNLPNVHEIVHEQPTRATSLSTERQLGEMSARIVRTETRLVKLMAHLGLDAEGAPIKDRNRY